MKIISNKAKCTKCEDVIESKYAHDFKWCSCNTIAVDGGKSYLKRLYKHKEDIEEMSETVDEVILEICEDDGGLELILRIEDRANSVLAYRAKAGMIEIKEDAYIKGYLIFETEFIPYVHQDYTYTIKVDSEYNIKLLSKLIKELSEYNDFRIE